MKVCWMAGRLPSKVWRCCKIPIVYNGLLKMLTISYRRPWKTYIRSLSRLLLILELLKAILSKSSSMPSSTLQLGSPQAKCFSWQILTWKAFHGSKWPWELSFSPHLSNFLVFMAGHWYMEPTLLVSYRLPRQCWNRDAYKFNAKFVWNSLSDDCSIGIPEYSYIPERMKPSKLLVDGGWFSGGKNPRDLESWKTTCWWYLKTCDNPDGGRVYR